MPKSLLCTSAESDGGSLSKLLKIVTFQVRSLRSSRMNLLSSSRRTRPSVFTLGSTTTVVMNSVSCSPKVNRSYRSPARASQLAVMTGALTPRKVITDEVLEQELIDVVSFRSTGEGPDVVDEDAGDQGPVVVRPCRVSVRGSD